MSPANMPVELGTDDKNKDELAQHSPTIEIMGNDNDAEPAAGAAAVEVPHIDPQAPSTSSTDSASLDYFTSAFTETHSYLPAPTPRPAPSIAGSDAVAPGTILSPDATVLLDHHYHIERPVPHRELSALTTASMRSADSNDTVTQQAEPAAAAASEDHVDHVDHGWKRLSASATLPPRPSYPNQAYAALQSQHYPTRNHPPILRQRSSHPTQILTYPPSLHQSGSRTVGSSPSATPSAGLYSPRDNANRQGWDSAETPGTYASPYLHPTHRQAPKETHVADVDVDPISGRKLINHYEIIDELGRGTHGKVKLGRDLETADTHVAIKIVERYSKRRRLGRLGNPEDKVKKEVAILKKARHPHIVALLEVIDDPSRKKVYIVLEWVERGTIHWRANAPKEIALLESHRYERERSGVQTGASQAEDNAVRREVARRLHRRKFEIDRLYRQARKQRDPDRGIDHYGGNAYESDDDTLSRISTTTNESSIRGQRRKSVIEPTSITEDRQADGLSTPTVEQPQLLLDSAERLHTKDAMEAASAREHVNTEDLRQWAAALVDDDLNPELQYVPCMTLQNIRVAFRDTLLGLQYLHYQGIIHRDIKPPNLLQTIDHRVKISDFGVSYLGRPVHDGEPGEDVSESEAKDLDVEAKELAKTVGTPAFYAPELCITDHMDDPPPITKAIDVWALGVTLFCMIFARTPFVDSEYVVMRQIADDEVYLPRRRLQPVDDKPKSRPNSRTRAYSTVAADRRSEFDIVYEDIDDDLHDLLKRLLIKDPRKRITLEEVRHHPWLLADLPNKLQWVQETDIYGLSQGKKIEVSKEDLNTAVVPLQWVERMRSGIKKIGDRLLGSSSRGRSTSSANSGSAPNSQPPSAHSSSSTISQDARRNSLRSEEIFTVLKAQRDAEHPLATSVAVSPEFERANQDFFTDMPPHFGVFNDFGASLTQTMSHDSLARPPIGARSKTGVSTTASIRTIKQSDFPEQARTSSPPTSPGLPGTPRALDSSGGHNFSSLLGASHRSVFKTIRERSSNRSMGTDLRESSLERSGSVSSRDAHAEPSLAISEALAVGRLQTPDVPFVDTTTTTTTSASNSEHNSPMALQSQNYRTSLGTRSRQSSTSSGTSQDARLKGHDLMPVYTPPRTTHNESIEEDWRRGEEQYMRRLLQETRQHSRPSSAFDDRDCPPSPDDERTREVADARRISEIDISRPTSSCETSPTTHGPSVLPSVVSSSSDFGSAISTSMSNPSIPSAISEASSIDRTDGMSVEEVESKHIRGWYNTIQIGPRQGDESVDEGYNPDEDMALDSDPEDSDSDTDSDGGLVMSRRKSASRVFLSSSPRNALPSALDSGNKQRRGTGLSRSSKKSSRSGSSNTMKKVRTRDSVDEHRRASSEATTIEGSEER